MLRHPQHPGSRAFTTQLQRSEALLAGLAGSPVTVELQPELTVSGRKLLSSKSYGRAVYAATFIRERRTVLEQSLLRQPDLFRAVLLHEVFHFVWVRLGNPRRASFAELLEHECANRGKGELGESSLLAKVGACGSDGRTGSKKPGWNQYVCESFCDTAAYLLSGCKAGNDCGRFGKRWTEARRKWFSAASADGWKF